MRTIRLPSRLTTGWLIILAGVVAGGCRDNAGPELPHTGSVEVAADCSLPAVPDATSVLVSIDVPVYTAAGELLTLDLVQPASGGRHPLVVLIHGGGWVSGSQHELLPVAGRLAAVGYVAASLGYRLAPQYPFPASVEDIGCALRFLQSRADSLNIEPGRVVLIGASAGGHLAALTAIAPAPTDLDTSCPYAGLSISVDGVVAYYSPFDLRRTGDFDFGTQIAISELLGASPEVVPQLAGLASPVTHVDGADPPFLLIHGTADEIVSIAQSRAMRDALAEASVPVTLLELDQIPHSFGLVDEQAALRSSSCTTLSFLDTYLAPNGK